MDSLSTEWKWKNRDRQTTTVLQMLCTSSKSYAVRRTSNWPLAGWLHDHADCGDCGLSGGHRQRRWHYRKSLIYPDSCHPPNRIASITYVDMLTVCCNLLMRKKHSGMFSVSIFIKPIGSCVRRDICTSSPQSILQRTNISYKIFGTMVPVHWNGR